VHVPGRSVAEAVENELKESEVEIGMGIHNEDGSERKTTELPGLVKTMLSHCLDTSDKDRNFLDISRNDEVVLLVNNLGGVSVLELGGITNEVVEQLAKDWKIKPVRVLSGTFMTSLNGLGFSISLLKTKNTGLGSGCSMLELLDAPAEASGWSAAVSTETWQNRNSSSTLQHGESESDEVQLSNLRCAFLFMSYPCLAANIELVDSSRATSALTTALNRLITAEPDITNYDTIVGDGDCGIGLKRGAEGSFTHPPSCSVLIVVAILKMLERSKKTDDALVFLQNIIQVVEVTMDGTSGAIYAIFLNALAHGLLQNSPSSPQPIDEGIWAKALDSSLEALSKYTPAQPGDRTLMDALVPFVIALSKEESIEAAAKAAEEGAQGTKGMKASLGRTVYVGGEGWQGVPDPGAHGLAELLLGLRDGLSK
jgi:dihydroxyacetone kinase